LTGLALLSDVERGDIMKDALVADRLTLRGGFALLALVMACEAADSRDRLKSVMRDSLPELAKPVVGFDKDSTHLIVYLETTAFPTMPESVLTNHAKHIGALAVRRYERPNELESVTVLYREPVRRGVWYIRHVRTFPVAMLSSAP